MDALLPRPGEVRAFVSSPQAAADLRARGVKVALGDISDGSHVGGAAVGAFCAILIGEAATDDRERSFAADREAVVAAWVEGLNDTAVQRVILVEETAGSGILADLKAESAVVATSGREPDEITTAIAALEDAVEL